MRALVALIALLATFAIALTVHVFASMALGRDEKSRGFAAFFVPPLVPYFAFKAHRWIWLGAWCGAVLAYGIAWWFASQS